MYPLETVVVGAPFVTINPVLLNHPTAPGTCSITNDSARFYDLSLSPIKSDSQYFYRSSESCIFGVASDYSSFKWGYDSVNDLGCKTNSLWGVNSNGYEDFVIILEYWDSNQKTKTWFQSFTLRIENKCIGKAIVMGNAPSTMTTYAGATLELTGDNNMFTGTTVGGSGSTTSDCPIQAKFEVKIGNNWYSNTDVEYWKVVNEANGPSGTGVTSSMKFKPSTVEYGPGKYDEPVDLTIRVSYLIGGSNPSKEFNLKVYPTSAVVKLCSEQTETRFSLSLINNESYTV